MNFLPSLRVRLLATGITACLAAMAIMALSRQAWSSADLVLFDRFSAVLGAGQVSGRVALVEVDEITLAQFGRWPWPQAVVGRLVHTLAVAGADTVALDFLLSEADAGPDPALAQAMKEVPVVAGHYFRFEGHPDAATDCTLPTFSGWTGPARPAMSVVCQAAPSTAGQGFLNLFPDTDGVLRRAPLVVRFNGQIYPSLGLAAVNQFGRQQQLPGLSRYPQGELFLRYREAGAGLPRYSAGQLMKDPVPEPGLRGKLVVVGASAGGQGAPLLGGGRLLPAPVVQATVADNLLAGDAFDPPGTATWLEWLLAALAVLLIPQLFIWWSEGPACGLALAVGGAIGAGTLAGMAFTGAYISPLPAALAGAVCTAGCTVLRVRAARSAMKHSDHQVTSAKHFILNALALLTTMRDPETGDHLQRIERYMRVLCRSLSHDPRYRPLLSEDTIHLMVQLAPIHDVGKVGVPDHILRKAGALTPEELQVIRQHVVFGRDVLQKASDNSGLDDEKFFRMAYELVYSHHERWDGRGYPQGLTGEGIPLAARLMAVADVYDALVSKRVYKEAFSHEEAVRIIKAESARHFDPAVVEAFLRAEQDFQAIRIDSQKAAAAGG